MKTSGPKLTLASLIFGLTAFLLMFSGSARAQELTGYTLQNFLDWFKTYEHAKPEFKPGDTLTSKDLEKLRPFIIPGYLEQLNFPEMKLHVMDTQSHKPRHDYMSCTEKYQSQVKLKSDGTLANYVCGQPFADSALDPNDPTSGMKAAWNFEYRWQNNGLIGISCPGRF